MIRTPVQGREFDSPGIFAPYDTCRQKRSGSPASSHSRHLPSSGFDAPSRRFAPSHAWRRPVSRHSVHRILPTGPCSSRPAVPLAGPRLSCRFLRTVFPARPRLQRLLRSGKGPDNPPPHEYKAKTTEPCPPGVVPFKAFSSVASAPASRRAPLLPFRPKVLPTFPLPGGAPGV